MSKVYRVYVQKRKEYAVESQEVLNNLKTQLNINTLNELSIVNRYDVEGISEEVLQEGIKIILSEPMVDDVILEDYPILNNNVFAIEYLPGQYDQRADACEQCFQILTGNKNVKVKCAKLIVINESVSKEDIEKIQKYMINPVDQRLASLEKVNNLSEETPSLVKI